MPLIGWMILGIVALVVLPTGGIISWVFLDELICGVKKSKIKLVISVSLTLIIMMAAYFGLNWYYTSTASGRRAVIDQQSDINNGLDRVVTVYTADGNVIAKYEGKIDIESNDGGYVIFDFKGKRYMYYNCFVESIADIE